MKCYCCSRDFKSYQELAEHIIANEDDQHAHAGAIRWANRYSAGVRHTPREHKRKVSSATVKYPDGFLQRSIVDNDKCLLCGQPREKCCC